MDIKIKDKFSELWKTYFGKSELPFIFYFNEEHGDVPLAKPSKEWRCLICELSRVRKGESLAFNADSLACGGAKRYLGYEEKMRPNFEYFLSCGLQGVVEGERYKRTPEIVLETQKHIRQLPSDGKFAIFKRWDKLSEADNPEVVIFFAKPDVLSGLFTLANYDEVETTGVISPFGAGCGSIIHFPFWENRRDKPKCVLGMFDPSARPCVPESTLSFAVPMKRFIHLIDYMEESFLITDTWKTNLKRIKISN